MPNFDQQWLNSLISQSGGRFTDSKGVNTLGPGEKENTWYKQPDMSGAPGFFDAQTAGGVLDRRINDSGANNRLFDVALGNNGAPAGGTPPYQPAPTTPGTVPGTKPLPIDDPSARTNSAGELSPEFQPSLAQPRTPILTSPNGQPIGGVSQSGVVTSSPNPQGSNGSVVNNTYGGGGWVPSGGGGSGVGSINTGGSVATAMPKGGGMANSVAGSNPAGYDYHNDPNYAHATTTSINKGGASSAGAPTLATPNNQRPRGAQVDSRGWLMLPDGTQLNDRHDPRLWGTAGNIFQEDMGDTSETGQDSGGRRPGPVLSQYWQVAPRDSEDGGPDRYELKPEVAARLRGRVQVGQAGVGGGGEVFDPSRVEYDPEFGFLTDPRNIKPPVQSNLQRVIGPIIMAAFGGAAGAAGAGLGNMAGQAFAGTGLEGAVSLANTGRQIYGAANRVNNLVNPRGKIGYDDGTGDTNTWEAPTGSDNSVGSSNNPYPDLTNGGRNNNADTGSGSSGSDSLGGFLGNLVNTGVNAAGANRNLQNFTNENRRLMDRGDPYGAQPGDIDPNSNRGRAIRRLADLENDPSSIYKSPTFLAAQQAIDDAIRARGAATGNMASGREMVDLADAMRSHGEQSYNTEWQRTAREAGVFFDPSSMAGRGMQANADAFRARNNRDATNNAALNRALTNNPLMNAAYQAIRNGTATQTVVSQFQQWYRNLFGDSSSGVPNVDIDNPLDIGDGMNNDITDGMVPDLPYDEFDYGGGDMGDPWDGFDWSELDGPW